MAMEIDPSRSRRRQPGFTLLEVLIALAVLAIALGAVIKVASQQAVNTQHLVEKTLAHWVAMNRIAEMQLTQQWPTDKKKKGTEMMGEHEWHWRWELIETPDPRVRQLEVRVFREREDDNPLTRLTSFLAQPK